MNLKNIISFVVLINILTGCGEKEPKMEIEYNNILICSDLSSRIENNPNDSIMINMIIDYFVRDCVKPGLKTNDRSSIYFSRINEKASKCGMAKIDIGEIDNLQEKQKFVNNTCENNNLKKAISEFKNTIGCVYSERDKVGLDILSLLNDKIENSGLIKKSILIPTENDTTTLKFQNHLIIFTDGYLEFSKKDGNKSYYFGEKEIKAIRNFCINNNCSLEQAINNNPKFSITPLISENNKFINLYVLETYDRGINQITGTIKNGGTLSDNNILKLVWEKWAKDSGFKKFKWRTSTTGSPITKDYIKNLIEQE